jgi:hypothetical protein
MTTKQIGITFPPDFLWQKYESQYLNSLVKQVETKFNDQKNLIINLTWFGPQFLNHKGWKDYQQLLKQNSKFDNLFLLCTVDPAMINPEQIESIVKSLGSPQLFKIGNFDTEYHFNFFAPVLLNHFKSYTNEELLLKEVKLLYINYNRKPRQHRVDFVKKLQYHQLEKYGIVTLGKPNVIYDKDPNNQLYLTIGENPQDYVESGHWYTGAEDPFGLPHDILSLHRLDYWQHHFLNIIGATEFNVWDDIFVSETQFKPILGLRPFLINGNPRTYQWLESNGFKTFNHYFDWIDFNNPDTVHDSIIEAIVYLTKLSQVEILNIYNHMLPDLIYNQQRFFEFAKEQEYKISHLFK